MNHTQAKEIADMLVDEMRPYCHKVEIAGSVRRLKPEVKDIELLAIPKWESVAAGFFAEDVSRNNSLYCRWALGHPYITWIKTGTHLIVPWPITEDGKYWRGLIASSYVPENGVKLDLFLTTPEQWGILFVIRSGPSEFSEKMVTQQHKGGWLSNDYSVAGGNLWRKGVVVPCPEEQDFFNVTSRKWIPPEKRV